MADKQPFQRIIVHCSDSEFGHALMIREWHIQRGFDTIGYHAVVLNGYPTADWVKANRKVDYLEGSIEWGRVVDSDEWFEGHELGASAKGYNTGAFGICMIGKTSFSDKVLNATLNAVRFHMNQFNLGPDKVVGHFELDAAKTCPNISMKAFRRHLVEGTSYGQNNDGRNGHSFAREIFNSFLKRFYK